ncbi:hypothetical protein KCP76_13285 [Salmonella enterica subsp. enterica serovar Weltevreden]|nr:hypothetical protein KCP76_13285 [Salmonella enterica subsp. enterica serovar Weltevreden]
MAPTWPVWAAASTGGAAAVIHAKDEASWQEAAKAVKAAVSPDDKAPASTPSGLSSNY